MMYGCIAEKLSHSFSKDIHNRLFDYSYELLELTPDELPVFLQKKDFKAINVTIPYKEKVIPFLDHVSDVAAKIGAVNTIVNKNGVLYGHNTDFAGMTALIKRRGIDLFGKKVLILGSGGTSKTAFAVAEALGAASVTRVSRGGNEDCITYDEARACCSDADIIINTTPVGMYPNLGNSPVDLSDYPNVSAVVDAVYNPLRSQLVTDAEKKGINAVGGLYMLVAQAAFAAELFLDTKVEVSEIDRVFNELVLLKRNIVLTGMPGSGKSTIGRLLAKKLGVGFIDTDDEVIKDIGMPIPDYFAKYGEAEFRKKEREAVDRIASLQGVVIATGGGVVLDEHNTDMLSQNGKIYFIDRDINSIAATSDRPLSSNRADLEKRYKERYPLYCARCDRHTVISDDAEENAKLIYEDFVL